MLGSAWSQPSSAKEEAEGRGQGWQQREEERDPRQRKMWQERKKWARQMGKELRGRKRKKKLKSKWHHEGQKNQRKQKCQREADIDAERNKGRGK